MENAAFLALKDTRITIPFLGSINNSGNFTPAYMENWASPWRSSSWSWPS